MNRTRTRALMCLLLALLGSAAAAAESGAPAAEPLTVWQLYLAGGLINYFITFLSVVVLGFVVYMLVALRASVVIPRDFCVALANQLSQGNLSEAMRLCDDTQHTVCARIVSAGLRRKIAGQARVHDSIESAGKREAARLYNQISFLASAGTLSPMLGLLGTVVGMMITFRGFGPGETSISTFISQGIMYAMSTTAAGLIVGIPAMAFFYYFKSRTNNLVAELEAYIEEVSEMMQNAPLHQPAPAQTPTVPLASR